MADIDDLDILSNAELRAKMVSQGLPNIPVTDSSRKVLVKRLRASLSGVAPGSPSSAAASPKKSSNRRDTLQPSSSSVAQITAPKARRTLAVATPTKEAKETERPNRMAEEKTKQPSLVPIQTRRKSNTNTAPPSIEQRDVAKKPETILEESQPPKRNIQHEKTLEVNSLIVLESDDEEDEEMLKAAAKAEQEFQRSQKTKLSTTTTKTHEYISSSQTVEPPRPRQYEPVVPSRAPVAAPAPVQSRAPVAAPAPVQSRAPVAAPAPVQSRAPALAPVTSQSAIGTGGSSSAYDYLNTQGGRYSSYTSSSAQGYGSAKTNPSSVTTSYRHSPAAHLYPNQLSDDNDDEEEVSQYESTFARNLARLRAEKIGDRSSPYTRRTVAGTSSSTVGYEPRARRSLRPEGASVSVAFSNWINSLDQKYGLKSKLFILAVILILIGVYNLFY